MGQLEIKFPINEEAKAAAKNFFDNKFKNWQYEYEREDLEEIFIAAFIEAKSK